MVCSERPWPVARSLEVPFQAMAIPEHETGLGKSPILDTRTGPRWTRLFRKALANS